MARTVTTVTTVYTFDELNENAKANAREQWGRYLWNSGSALESMEMIFDDMTEEAGWVNVSGLTFDLYSQGGYPSWSGDLPEFVHGDRAYYVTVRDHRYYGPTIDIDESDNGEPLTQEEHAAVTDAVRDHVSDLSSRLFYAFRAEDEYQSSEEAVREAAEANGYEYDEAGNLA